MLRENPHAFVREGVQQIDCSHVKARDTEKEKIVVIDESA
jgi:hypothetical protein